MSDRREDKAVPGFFQDVRSSASDCTPPRIICKLPREQSGQESQKKTPIICLYAIGPFHRDAVFVRSFPVVLTLLLTCQAQQVLAATAYRSIGTDGGVLYTEGKASVQAGSSTVTFSNAVDLPGDVGQGDRLTLDPKGANEVVFILSRDSAGQVTLQTPATNPHTVVDYTITRAYTTIQGWEDDRQGDLVATDRIEVGVCYNDGAFDELVMIDGSTTDADHYMHLTVAPGHRHNGIAGLGVRIEPTAAGHAILIQDDHTRVEWLEITDWSTKTVGSYDGINIKADNVLIQYVLIHDDGNGEVTNPDCNGITLELSNMTATVRNSLIYNIARSGIAIHLVAGATLNIENCTLLRCTQDDSNSSGYGCVGRYGGSGTINAKNVVAMDAGLSGRDFFGTGWGTSSNNLSSDDTAPGSSSLTDKSSADQFLSVEVGKEDLHLQDGADAIDAGVDLSEGFEDDIDGMIRPIGKTWDIGADEYGSPGVTITESGGSTDVDETGPTLDAYTVVLDSQPTAEVTITVTPDGQVDLGAGPSTAIKLTFTLGDWNVDQKVVVTAVDDAVAEGAHIGTITHSATSGDANYDGIGIKTVEANVADDDTAGISVSAISGPTTEVGGTATFTVVLDSEPTGDVGLGLTSNDTTEGTVWPASLTFTPEAWDVPQTVTVTGVDDDVDDGEVGYTIVTAAAASADPFYDGLDASDVDVTNTDDDTAGINVSAISGPTSEMGVTATFTVRLGSEPTADVTLGLSSGDTTEGTVLPASLTFTPENWDASQIVTVTGVDDDVDDGDVAYKIVLAATSPDANYDGLDPDGVEVSNTDNDVAGVQIAESDGSTAASEAGPTSDTYTVVLTSEPTADVAITIDPDDETDLGEGSGQAIELIFTSKSWDVPRTVVVTAVDDAAAEGNHTSTIVHSTTSDDAGYDGIAVQDVAVDVTDDDAAGVCISESAGSTVVSEAGPTSDTYTVVLTGEPAADVTITATPDDQTNLGAGAGVPIDLAFTAATWDQPQTVTVAAVDDAVAEGPHTSTIGHSATSSDAQYDGIADENVSVEVTDNDAAGVSITESDGSTGVSETGPTSDTYTVALASEPTGAVTVTATPDDQTDLGAGAGVSVNLTFTTANWGEPHSVTVVAVDDAVVERSHTSTITHSASSGDASYNGIDIGGVTVEVLDNDAAGVSITESDGSTDVSETGPTSDTYTVALASDPTGAVTVTATPDDQTDLGAGAGVSVDLTFTTANWGEPQTVTVAAVDDTVAEGPHASTVTHSVTSIDADYDGISVEDVAVDVTDNDVAGVRMAESDGSTAASEGDAPLDFYTVALDSRPTARVTITATPDDQTDLGAGAGVPVDLTFTTANWHEPQSVTVTAVDDAVAEGDHTSTIVHSATSDDPAYDAAAIADVTVEVSDNDAGGVSLTESNGSTRVSEAGPTSDTYMVVLTSEPTADVTITIDPDDETDLGDGPGQAIDVTFTTASWGVPRAVAVTAVDDAAVEGDHTSTITHSATSGDVYYDEIVIADLVANVEDNDTSDKVAGVAITESDGSTAVSEAGPTADEYTLVLQGKPTAVVTITVDPDDQTDLGNGPGAPVDLTFTMANWDRPQTVTVVAVEDAVAEGVQTSAITHTSTSGDADYNGITIDTVIVSVEDDDAVGVRITEPNSATAAAEGGGTYFYALALSSQPTSEVTITITPDGQLDVGAGPGTARQLTFDGGDWSVPKTVTVTATPDDLEEGFDVGTIEYRVESADARYDGLPLPDVPIIVFAEVLDPNSQDEDSPGGMVEAVTVTTRRYGWCGPFGPLLLGAIALTLIAMRCSIGPSTRRTKRRALE